MDWGFDVLSPRSEGGSHGAGRRILVRLGEDGRGSDRRAGGFAGSTGGGVSESFTCE